MSKSYRRDTDRFESRQRRNARSQKRGDHNNRREPLQDNSEYRGNMVHSYDLNALLRNS